MTDKIDLETATEGALKLYLEEYMSRYFVITPEPKGVHLIEGNVVIPDFLFWPRAELLERGFDDVAIVVEVKCVYGHRSLAKPWFRAVRACWQAASYAQAEFDGVRPAFALLFPDFDVFHRAQIRENEKFRGDWLGYKTLTNFAQFAGVGCIKISSDTQWKISLGGQRYFSSDKGGNVNKLARPRLGNF